MLSYIGPILGGSEGRREGGGKERERKREGGRDRALTLSKLPMCL